MTQATLTVTLLSGSTPDDARFMLGLDGFHHEGEGREVEFCALEAMTSYRFALFTLEQLTEKESEAA